MALTIMHRLRVPLDQTQRALDVQHKLRIELAALTSALELMYALRIGMSSYPYVRMHAAAWRISFLSKRRQRECWV